jgi:hypothetical protein
MPIWLERDVTSTTTSKEGIAICDMDDATKIHKSYQRCHNPPISAVD